MTKSRRATLMDVAREAEVSLKTASRVINGVPTVSSKLRDRVISVSSRLGYRPHRGAATMRSGHSDMVGMIIRDLGNLFYSQLVAGAAEEAEKHNCLVISCSSEGSPERETRLSEAIFAQRPRGLLITPTRLPPELISTEVALGTPVVAIDEKLSNSDVDTVTFDNYRASRDAVALSVAKGRKRFAIMSDTDELQTMEPRIRGALDALKEAGLGCDPAFIRRDVHTEEQARVAGWHLLSSGNPPDAIFCANNVSALGAAATIHSTELDVAIISFDAFPLSHTLSHPVIVVDHDDREMGRQATRLLFKRVANPDRPVEQLLAPTTLYDLETRY